VLEKLQAGHRDTFGKQRLMRETQRPVQETQTCMFKRNLAVHKDQFQKHIPVREELLAVNKNQFQKHRPVREKLLAVTKTIPETQT
jgi:hypothetical protein